jgi:hypothetical protein
MPAPNEIIEILKNYPEDHVDLIIHSFKEPGDVINEDEVCDFTVSIHNKGYLDMLDVYFHVNSVAGLTLLSQTDIAGNPINFTAQTLTTAVWGKIPAGSWAHSRKFFMLAQRPTDETQLFEVHLGGWRADLSTIDFSGHDWDLIDTYEAEIYPD